MGSLYGICRLLESCERLYLNPTITTRALKVSENLEARIITKGH